MLTSTAMAAISRPALQERFISTAKELVSRDIGLLGRAGEVWNLAGDLHKLGGEAAMVNLPEVAQAAREGEEAARLLGAASDRQARVTCGRLLRKLSYLLQELSATRATRSARDIAQVTQQQRRATEQVGPNIDDMAATVTDAMARTRQTTANAAELAAVALQGRGAGLH